jgi:hypothetical protein
VESELPRDFLRYLSEGVGLLGVAFVTLAAIVTAIRSSHRPELHKGMVIVAVAFGADAVLSIARMGLNLAELEPEAFHSASSLLWGLGLLATSLILVGFLLVKPPPEVSDG